MERVFISYARDDLDRVEELADRLRSLVDGVWFDSQLHGGEDWWSGILEQIRECDAFLAVVSRASMESEACRVEREYARVVNRSILPVALEKTTHPLPSDIASLQIVDFSVPGEQAIADLARALLAAPDARPLPDPLPPEPKAPLSYLSSLVDLVDSSRELTKSEQVEIVTQLESGLESADPDERDGARQLLSRMAARTDLASSVDKTIALLLRDQAPAPLESSRHAPAPAQPTRPETSTRPHVPEPGSDAGRSPKTRRWLAVAVVAALIAASAAVWAAVGGSGSDSQAGPDDAQTEEQADEGPVDPDGEPDEVEPPEPDEVEPPEPDEVEPPEPEGPGKCGPPVVEFPGLVEAGDTVDTHADERILRWVCLLFSREIIGAHVSNFTGNYGGGLPEVVVAWKVSRQFPEPTPVLDQVLFHCLVDGDCPSEGPGTLATPDGFHVTEVVLTAEPANFEGACPATITFRGHIGVDGGGGEVRYRFFRSDGATGPEEVLGFDGPGRQEIVATWTLGGERLPSFEGWEAVQILAPAEMQSPKAQFRISCL